MTQHTERNMHRKPTVQLKVAQQENRWPAGASLAVQIHSPTAIRLSQLLSRSLIRHPDFPSQLLLRLKNMTKLSFRVEKRQKGDDSQSFKDNFYFYIFFPTSIVSLTKIRYQDILKEDFLSSETSTIQNIVLVRESIDLISFSFTTSNS